MGKKKQKRISLDQDNQITQKVKKMENINDHCLVLTFKDRKKIIANFQPPYALKSGETKSYIGLNYDGFKCSPAFLYENKTKPIAKYQQAYNNKINAAKDKIQIPDKPVQPREKKNKQGYCAVCKKNYAQYLQHVKLKQHLTNMQESQFTKHLRKIQKFYADKKERRNRNKRHSHTRRTQI